MRGLLFVGGTGVITLLDLAVLGREVCGRDCGFRSGEAGFVVRIIIGDTGV